MYKNIILALMLLTTGVEANAKSNKKYNMEGVATWYGKDFHGKKTASGKKFNMYGLTAAHKTLKLGSKVKVINVNNGKSVVVEITDRGPYVKGKVIDLSKAAAIKIDMLKKGNQRVKIKEL